MILLCENTMCKITFIAKCWFGKVFVWLCHKLKRKSLLKMSENCVKGNYAMCCIEMQWKCNDFSRQHTSEILKKLFFFFMFYTAGTTEMLFVICNCITDKSTRWMKYKLTRVWSWKENGLGINFSLHAKVYLQSQIANICFFINWNHNLYLNLTKSLGCLTMV